MDLHLVVEGRNAGPQISLRRERRRVYSVQSNGLGLSKRHRTLRIVVDIKALCAGDGPPDDSLFSQER